MRGLFPLPPTFNQHAKMFAKKTRLYGIAMQSYLSPKQITLRYVPEDSRGSPMMRPQMTCCPGGFKAYTVRHVATPAPCGWRRARILGSASCPLLNHERHKQGFKDERQREA